MYWRRILCTVYGAALLNLLIVPSKGLYAFGRVRNVTLSTATHVHKITDVSVFYMAHGQLDSMILMQAKSFLVRPLEGVVPRNGYCPHQNHYVPRHKKQVH